MMKPIIGPEQICSADATMKTLLEIHIQTLLRCPNGAAALQRVFESTIHGTWEQIEHLSEAINDEISGMDLWFGVDSERMVAITEMGADYYRDVTADFREDAEALEQLMTPTPQERYLNYYLNPMLRRDPQMAKAIAHLLNGYHHDIGPALAYLITSTINTES